jgi:polyhydroxyalkanoate synthesis repressor PhaR
MTETVVLKRYANRRLYNTEKSAYVTLVQVADLIKAGRDVKIIDAKTEEEITAYVLTQIIVEEAKNKNSLIPSPLLHLVIRHGENVLGEFFEKYLQISIENYLTFKRVVDGQLMKWMEIGAVSGLPKLNIPPVAPLVPFVPFADLSMGSAMDSKTEKK